MTSLEFGSAVSAFRRNVLDAAAASELAQALCDNHSLTALGLRGVGLARLPASSSSSASQPAGLLGLSGGGGGGAGAGAAAGGGGVVRACEALGEMLARNRSLTFLSLEDNQVCVGVCGPQRNADCRGQRL